MDKTIELFNYYLCHDIDSVEFKIKQNKDLYVTNKFEVDGECFECTTILNPYDANRLREFLNSTYDGTEGMLR